MKMQRVWNGRKLVYRPVSRKVETVNTVNTVNTVGQSGQKPNDIDERRRLAAEIAKSL